MLLGVPLVNVNQMRIEMGFKTKRDLVRRPTPLLGRRRPAECLFGLRPACRLLPPAVRRTAINARKSAILICILPTNEDDDTRDEDFSRRVDGEG